MPALQTKLLFQLTKIHVRVFQPNINLSIYISSLHISPFEAMQSRLNFFGGLLDPKKNAPDITIRCVYKVWSGDKKDHNHPLSPYNFN